jgi:hypothetical protein
MMREPQQALLQAVNDRIYEILDGYGDENGNFVCECGTETCSEAVRITLREYAALRAYDERPPTLRSRACPRLLASQAGLRTTW